MTERTHPRPNRPLLAIAGILGAAGIGHLVGPQFVKDEYARLGYPPVARVLVGAIQTGIAATALAGLRDDQARTVAVAGTLCSMAGATATHIRGGDSPIKLIPAAFTTALALAARSARGT